MIYHKYDTKMEKAGSSFRLGLPTWLNEKMFQTRTTASQSH